MTAFTRTLTMFLVATLCLMSKAAGQAPERYIVLEGNTALAHVFNVSDNTEVATIKTGATPISAVISGDGRLAFVSNINSEHVSVIDLTIQAEIKLIRPLRLGELAVTADGSTIIGADVDDNKLKFINAATLNVSREIDLNGKFGDDPANLDLAFGPPVIVGNTVYLNTNFELGAMDVTTASVTLIDTNAPGMQIFTQTLAGTMDGKFVVAVREGALVVIDTSTNLAVRSFPGFFACVAATSNPASPDTVFVVRNTPSGAAFTILDVSTGQFLSDVPIPGAFADFRTQIASNGGSAKAYVGATTSSPNMLVIDTALALTNPAAAVTAQFTVGTQARPVGAGLLQIQPPPTAPVVSSVSQPLLKNDTGGAIQISGSGFATDAQVRLGNLDPIAAQVISASQLQVSVPPGSAAQGAAIVVTNPNAAQGVASAQQSGILRNAFVIASPPAFQPVNQVGVSNFAESTFVILNVSTNATLAPAIADGPRPSGFAITPDGSRAFIGNLFAPAAIDVYNFITNSIEAHITLNGATRGLESQTKGLVIAPIFGTTRLAAYVASSRPIGPNSFTLDLYVIGADPAAPGFETVVATIPTGAPNSGSVAGSLAVTPDGHYAFVQAFQDPTNSQVNIVVVDLSTAASVTIPGPSLGLSFFQAQLELSPDGKFLLASDDNGNIPVFDVSTNPFSPQLVTTIGAVPKGAFLLPRVIGSRLYAFDPSRNLVDIFNFNPAVHDFAELGQFVVSGATSVFGNVSDVTADGKLFYAVLKEQDAVAVVDTAKVIAHDPTALVTKIRTGIAPSMAVVRPGTPTPAGNNVPVRPIPEVTLNFSSVTTTGATTATTTNTNPDPLPAGFSLGTPPLFYEISSTAVFAGPIQVCIRYNPAQFSGPESNIQLLHDEGGVFIDVTTPPVDTVNHVVCGQVTHFSAFTVGTGSPNFFFNNLLTEIITGVGNQGLQSSLSAKVEAAKASFSRGQNQAAVHQLNAFEQEVTTQSGKKLSTSEAAKLLQMATGIIRRL